MIFLLSTLTNNSSGAKNFSKKNHCWKNSIILGKQHPSNPLVEPNVTPSLYRETTNCPYHFSSFERRQSVRDVGHAIRRANEGIEFRSVEDRKR